jgi:hypothetical protein
MKHFYWFLSVVAVFIVFIAWVAAFLCFNKYENILKIQVFFFVCLVALAIIDFMTLKLVYFILFMLRVILLVFICIRLKELKTNIIIWLCFVVMTVTINIIPTLVWFSVFERAMRMGHFP